MTSPTPPRRRWFRFSLRTLFVLVTAIALLAAGCVTIWEAEQIEWLRQYVLAYATYNQSEAAEMLRWRDELWQEVHSLKIRAAVLASSGVMILIAAAVMSWRHHRTQPSCQTRPAP